MTTTVKDNKKIFDFAYNLDSIARKNNWVPRYDIESDEFSFTAPRLSGDARIKYITDEFAFYITKSGKIEGIFLEYFKSNFVKHHRDFKDVLKDIDSKKYKEKMLIELDKKKIDEITEDLGEALQESLAENIKFQQLVSAS